MKPSLTKMSRFLSLVLRHDPAAAHLSLNQEGWVTVDELLEGLGRVGKSISREMLDEIVERNDKKRFAFSEDGRMIRANQGHSIRVDLALPSRVPPEMLFHGTADRFLESILGDGIQRQQRDHVHLSGDKQTAVAVGRRHGFPVVLEVAAAAMHEAGHIFCQAANGVWLTNHVPPKYLSIHGATS